MARINKTVGLALRKNGKAKIFVFFLFLTSIIWFLIAFSKRYNASTEAKVNFYNAPNDQLFLSSSVSTMKVLVNASGFNILKYRINPPKISFDLKKSVKKDTQFYIVSNTQLNEVKTSLSKESTLLKFLTDTIFVEFSKNISKKVPIISGLKINFKLGYNLIEDLRITPDSIKISGPKRVIDSIFEVSTTKKEINDIYEDVIEELYIKLPSKAKNVFITNEKITIEGKVDKFTEGTFVLPVTIVNKPEGIKIAPFPKEIEVVYQSALSHFSKIKKNDITIVFDYSQYQRDSLVRYLTPIVKEKSSLISSLKINPTQIEFLIQKNEW
ncbi:MAG: hypothetical protein KBH29_06180 [Lutibacter sp.]|nr:hypothetical protein [Lutibacter sp.]